MVALRSGDDLGEPVNTQQHQKQQEQEQSQAYIRMCISKVRGGAHCSLPSPIHRHHNKIIQLPKAREESNGEASTCDDEGKVAKRTSVAPRTYLGGEGDSGEQKEMGVGKK